MQDEGIALYRRFLNGDVKSLETLISLYRQNLFRFICGYVYDEALAEDIMQETFLALYYQRTFKPRDDVSFKTYLYTIARNKSLNAVKKRKREVSLETLIENNTEAKQPVSPTPSAQENIERAEKEIKVQEAMQKIKADYREVLQLRYFEELPPEKIAKVTGRNTKQVYNLLSRGRVALKELLNEEGIENEEF